MLFEAAGTSLVPRYILLYSTYTRTVRWQLIRGIQAVKDLFVETPASASNWILWAGVGRRCCIIARNHIFLRKNSMNSTEMPRGRSLNSAVDNQLKENQFCYSVNTLLLSVSVNC